MAMAMPPLPGAAKWRPRVIEEAEEAEEAEEGADMAADAVVAEVDREAVA